MSNRQGVVYDANGLVVLTPGQLAFNGTTYDVAATNTANNASAIATAALAVANAALPKAGGTMTGDINMGGTQKVTNMGVPTAPGDATTKLYVDNLVTGVLRFKGSVDCSGNPDYPAATLGDAYVVSVAGKIGGAAGVVVEAGDVFFAIATNAGGTQAAVGSSWDVVQYNLTGVLLSANNLSDVQSAATSRTNLGLGSAATYAASAFAQTANNLSDLASAATARTNLGLGTAATQNSTAFATAAQGTLATTAVQRAGDTMSGNLSIKGASTTYLLTLGATTKGIDEYNSGGTAGDAVKVVANNAGAGFAVQNLNASGFAGVEYMDNAGAVKVFSGYQLSTGEFRFNQLASGGTIKFKIASIDRLAIANTGFVSASYRFGIGSSSTSYLLNLGQQTKGFDEYQSGSLLGDAIKAVANNAGAGFAVQNQNASGFSGIEYMDTAGTVKVFSGYQNSTGEFRFNQLAAGGTIKFKIASVDALSIANSGNVSIGNAATTARLALPAGTASANTAPLKLTSGTNLTTPEAGAMEYDGTSLYFTNGAATRYNLTSPSPWTFDNNYTSVSSGAAQYFNMGTLALGAAFEYELHVYAQVQAASPTNEMGLIKIRGMARRPTAAGQACQFLNFTTEKTTTTNMTTLAAFIVEDGITAGLIKAQVNGVTSYTIVGKVYGWIK